MSTQQPEDRLDEVVALLADKVASRLITQLEDFGLGPVSPTEPLPLTTDELASAKKVSPQTVRKWAKQGAPHTDIGGGRQRWQYSQVEAWLVARGSAK